MFRWIFVDLRSKKILAGEIAEGDAVEVVRDERGFIDVVTTMKQTVVD
jgi:hypothetical protein